MMIAALERQALLHAFEGEYGMTTAEFLARWHAREFDEEDGLDLLPFEQWVALAEEPVAL